MKLLLRIHLVTRSRGCCCARLFLISYVAGEVPGSTAGEVICLHCKTVRTIVEPDFGRSGRRFVVADKLPLEREYAATGKGVAASPRLKHFIRRKAP